MNQTIERTTLSNLLFNEDYARKVLPFIKGNYFDVREERIIFDEIVSFVDKYQKIPTQTSLEIEIGSRKDLNQDEHDKIVDIVKTFNPEKVDIDWLLDTTEKFCKDKAIYNAIVEGVGIIDGKDKSKTPDSIPSILTEALSVSFDNSVGHDYIEDAESRHDFYNKKEERIPFDLDFFNKITKGGLPSKTLNIALAGTGVGKSLFMCHMASNCLAQGKNVLYITMEMAEERIAERIDANMMNVNIKDLAELPKQMFEDKIQKITKKTSGKLIIKEYPTASAHSGHFRGLIKELAIKKSFKPDIIFIDYLNICASSRFKGGVNVNSYTMIKSIAEELRGLAVETNVPIMSATQTTRSGFSNTDVGLEDTSESFGLPATADLMFALISTEELEELNQICVKQLKNRYNDPTMNKRFVIGIDRAKMKLYDVEVSAQGGLINSGQSEVEDDGPVFDKGSFSKNNTYDKFSNFKV
jgi:replicative DNA helicase